MKITAKRLIVINAIAVGTIVLLFFLTHFLMKNEIECIVAGNVYMYCPGCGASRSAWSLLRLDLISSIRYNIAVPLFVVGYAYFDTIAILEIRKKGVYKFSKRERLLIYIFLGVVALNFLVKNILLWGFEIDLLGNFIKAS